MQVEQTDLTPESSEGVVTQDVPADEAEARSSGADQGESHASMLDAVRSAVGMDDEDAESPPAERVTEQPPAEDEPVDRDAMLLAALDELKDDKVPLHKIQRFREVLSENKALKGQFDVVKPAVDRLNSINEAARRAGFTPEEVADYFNAAALAKDDPAKAHEIVSRFASKLAQSAGTQLPEDLQRQVDDGYVTEELARETARLRAEAARAKIAEQLAAETQQREAVFKAQQGIAEAVNNYQRQLMSTDPDYTPTKHEMVKEALELLVVREGRPPNPDAALQMAKRAVETVNKRLSQFRPTPRQVTQPSGRRINAPAQSSPKSMREAIERTLTG